MRPPALLAAALTLCAVALPADAAGLNTASAAHRAIYNLTLNASRGGDVVAARGTMGYEVIDACDGWAVRQRLSMTLTNSEGQDIQMVSDYATWEAKDGLKFRFHMKQTTDTAVTSQTDGDARLEGPGGAGQAHYTVPEDTTKPLPAGTLFPMAHTSAILAAAQAGKKFVALPLFDGTDDSGAEDSSIVVLDWKKPEPNKYPLLASLPSTRVRLAFFDHSSTGETPTYQVGMRYWENGVADNLQMDFGDFVMDAKMTDLTPLPHKC
ncbi:MAG TPA: cell envelope integrity EipB family protein [Acetobacteraceae bacterium]|jgi:hypothetical protein